MDVAIAAKRLEKDVIFDRAESFVRDVLLEDVLGAVSRGERSLAIEFSELDKYDYELSDELLINTEEVLKTFEGAIDGLGISEKIVKVRLRNIPKANSFKIKDLRSEHLGRMVTVEGIIRQASEVRPEISKTEWECMKCQNRVTIFQTGLELKKPMECSEFTCSNRKDFLLVDKDFGDVQRVVIEENPENLEGSEQPSRLSVILRHDLVDPTFRRKITPGSIIKSNGILKEMPMKASDGGKKYDIFMEANHIEPLYQEFQEIDIKPEDEEIIKKIAADDPWKLVVGSIAPSIYGHDKIKEAVALQMFGGVRKKRPDGTWSRGDMHVLLVGDPGAGKSQILKYVSSIAPKSRYVSGKGASAVGLTATVVKDEFLGGWTLEAGAIVLANGGIVCLDEMDKISKTDVFALHEAMEQQSITVAKANIFATLRAETSILSAANPKFGRFDLSTPIAEQISMPETILSRFDLIFPVKDIPNPDIDEKLADHILSLHQNPDIAAPLIETKHFRKYIAYAKRNIHPKMTEGALLKIKTFFVELRNKYSDGSSVPISPRQLEALVRMTEASARLRLSPIADQKDATRAIDLLKYTLYQLAYDSETGKLDIDRMESATSSSKRSKIMIILEILRELEGEYGKEIPRSKVIEGGEARKMALDDIEKLLDDLRSKGYIIEPKQGYIERVE
ncbi:MAG: minichromosome maintenance protein MCM [Candidatus Altiarchaeota archaeon]|nr:minichromosome maintenance protein MCM [Candidatus Altiarchaeota archaeon]